MQHFSNLRDQEYTVWASHLLHLYFIKHLFLSYLSKEQFKFVLFFLLFPYNLDQQQKLNSAKP